jgi:sulfur-carrier protein
MKIRIQLFAVAKQLAGRPRLELDVPAGATIADLRQTLAQAYPVLSELLPQVLFAIDGEYADEHTRLPASGEVACIPPVSGG